MTVLRNPRKASGRAGARVAPLLALAAFVGLAVLVPATAGAHAERTTFFPDPNQGDFPQYRTDGP